MLEFARSDSVLARLAPIPTVAIAAGVFVAAAIVPFGFLLSWFGLSLFAVVVCLCKSRRTAAAFGGLFGAIFYGVQYDFVRTTGSADHSFGGGPFELHWIGLVISGCFIWGASAIGFYWTRERRWPSTVSLPVLILFSEVAVDIAARRLIGSTGSLTRLAPFRRPVRFDSRHALCLRSVADDRLRRGLKPPLEPGALYP